MFGTKTDISVFMTHVAITIIVALLASLLIAQTLVPMLTSRIKPPPPPKEGAFMSRLTERYAKSLGWTLRHPFWTSVGIGLTLLIGMAPILLQVLKFDMFPQEAGRRLYLPYHIEGQHPLKKVESTVDLMEQYFFDNQEEFNIRSVYSYYEKGSAISVLLLTEDDEATASTKEVIERIEKNLPTIAIGKPSFQFDQEGGGSGGEAFSIQVSGDSTSRLNELSTDLIRTLETVDGLQDIRSDAELGEHEVRVSIDRVRAAAAGLTSEKIAQTIATAMRGQNLREFRTDTGEVAVRLAFRADDRQTLEQLADLPLYTDSGQRITLGSVANFKTGYAPDVIRRQDRQTAIIISAKLADDNTLDDVRPKVEALMDEYELPPGYSWKFGRGFDRQDETGQMMLTNIMLGIACIFLVMAALFESLLLPFSIILGSIAFSVLGVFLFFWATGTTFSFMAMIGIMILIGVVVNNGIVLIDHINNLRQSGVPRNQAIIQGGRDRLRPILMTVATTIVGLAPLAVSTTQIGGDGPPYFPMARAIIGGLAFSTLVSLMVVPALYAGFDSMSAWGRRVMRMARGEQQPQPAPT
jgi:hydrophobic/amphiphilic exporter-1 (mainly G- bacteria), HAE1 family